MADITKCTNRDCPFKEKCYRWTAEAHEYQLYARFERTETGCEYLITRKEECDGE